MQKIAVIHYSPIEYYPPVTNFLNVVSGENLMISVFTTHNAKKRKVYEKKAIKIFRSISVENTRSSFLRFMGYFLFNFKSLITLIFLKPQIVIYYESYSALPAYLYLKIPGRKCKLWIHHHEYFDPGWYKNGMKTVQLYHHLEIMYLYSKATGISHTNAERVQLFLSDYPFLLKERLHVLPNYPPREWYQEMDMPKKGHPFKVVYVGSLSIKNTYIKEFCNWVINQNGSVLFDIYCYNIDNETKIYLRSLASMHITFFDHGIEYYDFPKYLQQYHAGLILYRDFMLNYRHNETNKLFEYLACGLDVWYSSDIKGPEKFITTETYPKIIRIDFNTLNSLKMDEVSSRENLCFKSLYLNCEEVYQKFLKILL